MNYKKIDQFVQHIGNRKLLFEDFTSKTRILKRMEEKLGYYGKDVGHIISVLTIMCWKDYAMFIRDNIIRLAAGDVRKSSIDRMKLNYKKMLGYFPQNDAKFFLTELSKLRDKSR